MARQAEPMYRKGDTVRIVDDPFDDCPFAWDCGMDDFCGVETEITDVSWIDWFDSYGYHIAADNGEFIWCKDCFEAPTPDIEESDSDINMLFGGAPV